MSLSYFASLELITYSYSSHFLWRSERKRFFSSISRSSNSLYFCISFWRMPTSAIYGYSLIYFYWKEDILDQRTNDFQRKNDFKRLPWAIIVLILWILRWFVDSLEKNKRIFFVKINDFWSNFCLESNFIFSIQCVLKLA